MAWCFSLLLLLVSPLHAQTHETNVIAANNNEDSASVDITASVEPSFNSWSELSTTTNRPSHSYFTQRGNIHLKIKEAPWTFNMRLEHLSLAGISDLPAPLARIPTRYPKPGPNLFISQANLHYQGLLSASPMDLKIGLIPIQYAQGLVLSDNGLGIFGLHLALKNVGPVQLELFIGNTQSSVNP